MENTQIHTFERPQRPRGFDLPARMSVIPLEGGGLALLSPLHMDDALASEIEALGEVRYLLAPNLLHHLHLTSALSRFPRAVLLAPPGLAKKRPELSLGGSLEGPLPPALAASLDVVHLEGAPLFDEYAFFHRESETLILTDLVFHVLAPKGLVTNLVLALVGCRGKLAASRSWGFAVKDRDAMRESLARVMALPFSRVVLAHGENLERDAKPRLGEALRARFGELRLLGA